MVRFRRKSVPEWVIAREHGLAVTIATLSMTIRIRSDVIRDRCLEPLPIVTLDYLKKEPKGHRAVGSALRASEGPRGQFDVRGHHLPNGGRVLETSGRERIGLVITTGPDC